MTGDDFKEYNHAQLPSDGLNFVSPLVRYDNYIDIYRKLYPKHLNKYYFATHDDGNYLEEIESYKPDIWDLQDNLDYWIRNNSGQWILNIDLDYFFVERKSKTYQFLTDAYISSICDEIEKAIDKIDVITSALSPEFCGGWTETIRMAELISDRFSLSFKLSID